jgi:hypothetical protein
MIMQNVAAILREFFESGSFARFSVTKKHYYNCKQILTVLFNYTIRGQRRSKISFLW